MPNTPQESRSLLIDGNKRFSTGNTKHTNASLQRLRDVAGKQEPFATIITCSDSRVPPEILFDCGIGELFVIRTAGNVLDETVIASVLYGVVHLATSLVLVLGHQSCGAVTAAFSNDSDLADEPAGIQSLIEIIRKNAAIVSGDTSTVQEDLLRAIDANAHAVVAQLSELPEIAKRCMAGTLSVIPGFFSFADGTVSINEVMSPGAGG